MSPFSFKMEPTTASLHMSLEQVCIQHTELLPLTSKTSWRRMRLEVSKTIKPVQVAHVVLLFAYETVGKIQNLNELTFSSQI